MIYPNWPAPKNIFACTSTRKGGISEPPYASLNLGNHVDDNPLYVAQNRQLFYRLAQLPCSPIWLQQTHSTDVLRLESKQSPLINPIADACFTQDPNVPCTIMTADCLPLLICNQQGTEVAAIHAGWRGLRDGIITETLSHLQSQSHNLLVWLGPAIGPQAFELNNEIRLDFLACNAQNSLAFKQVNSKWFADIYALARIELKALGVKHIFGGDYCTFSDEERFFSYRRDGITGRMASTIWLT